MKNNFKSAEIENDAFFQEDKYKQEIKHLKDEQDSLKNELNRVNIINEKIYYLLSLEVESGFDKLNQSKKEYESLIASLRENISNLNKETFKKEKLLSILGAEIDVLKQDINRKDEKILDLISEIDSPKYDIHDKNNAIDILRDYISFVKNFNKSQKIEIDSLNQEINELNDSIYQKEELIKLKEKGI